MQKNSSQMLTQRRFMAQQPVLRTISLHQPVGMCQILHLPEARTLSWLISYGTQPELLGMGENESMVLLAHLCKLKMFKVLTAPCKKNPTTLKAAEQIKPQKPSFELFIFYSLSHGLCGIHTPLQGQV